MNVYIEDAHLFSNARDPLVITELNDAKEMIDLMVVLEECKSNNINILRTTSDFNIQDSLFNHLNYSEIFVFRGSNDLLENIKTKFGEDLDSVQEKGTSVKWEIIPK